MNVFSWYACLWIDVIFFDESLRYFQMKMNWSHDVSNKKFDKQIYDRQVTNLGQFPIHSMCKSVRLGAHEPVHTFKSIALTTSNGVAQAAQCLSRNSVMNTKIEIGRHFVCLSIFSHPFARCLVLFLWSVCVCVWSAMQRETGRRKWLVCSTQR